MPKQENVGIKLRRLKVQNFKALDSLDLEFPPPLMKNDPDVFAMGSKNGVGKTSVLEACALLFLGVYLGKENFNRSIWRETPINIFDLLIRAGTNKAIIEGNFDINEKDIKIKLTFSKDIGLKFEGNIKPFETILKPNKYIENLVEHFLYSIIALNSEPLILSPFLYFHSYRKVQEGNPKLGMMVDDYKYMRQMRYRDRSDFPISLFKVEILKYMMSKASLFENFDMEESHEELMKLNDLVFRYAGGKIEKLRPAANNTVDIRITPENGSESYTFDGLSSGQKEIISTMFLIWHYTNNNPGIVLIDEPELHLNAEWHRKFMWSLYDIAPENQYIIATHSEDVFSAVPEDHRVLLTASGGGKG